MPNCTAGDRRGHRLIEAIVERFPDLDLDTPCALCVRGQVSIGGNALVTALTDTSCGNKKGAVAADAINISGSADVYGADGIFLLKTAKDKAAAFEAAGLGDLPICMAKTHLSLSHDATLLNAPTGFTVTVRDLRPYTGAGWIVALCGDMQTMPGLGKTPAAHAIDVDAEGSTVGLF